MESAQTAYFETRYLEALEHYRAARHEIEQSGASAEWKGRVLRGIGSCLAMLSDYRGALEQFLEARPYTVEGGNREDLSRLDSNIASIYLHQGDLENAARMYQAALRVGEQRNSATRVSILANLAVVDLRSRRYRQGLARTRTALEAARAVGDHFVEAWVHDLVGLSHLGLHDYARARESFERSLTLRRAQGQTADLTRSLMYLGRVELERGNPATSVETFDEAVAQGRDDRAVLWSALYYRGRAQWALGRRHAAIEDLRAAVDVLESIRLRLVPTDALRVQFEVSSSEVYAALADLLCETHFAEDRAGAAAEAFHVVELARAQGLRALIEQRQLDGAHRQTGLWMRYHDRLARLEATRARAAADPAWRGRLAEQEAELRDFEARLRLEEPVFSSGVFAPVLGLDQTQKEVLGPEDLLLSFHLREKAAYVWAVTRTEARICRLPPPSAWRGEIHRFRQGLDEAAERASAGGVLYRALLASLDPALLGKRHWIIVAGGDLVSLPFCALPAPGAAGKRYLVEQHSFSYAPSVSILHSLNQRGTEPYPYEFLGLADPVFNRADPRWDGRPPSLEFAEGLPRLISSEPEIRTAARLFPPGRSTLLTGFDASEARLRRSAEQSHRYWHLSSHVMVDAERPNHSFVALSIPRQGSRMEKLTALDIVWLPVRAEMVVLNGCDSGTGKTLPGEGVMGLARAFLAAGARSVVATRWKIPDESGALAGRLYGHLQNDGVPGNRAEALRQAQLEMIRAGDWRASPRYWAAYFLVGAVGEPRPVSER